MTRITRIVLATIVAAGLAGATALAQGPGPGMGPGYGMHPGAGMGPGMMGGWTYDQGWFDQAKQKIGIRPDQEPAWKTYVDAVRDNAQSMQDMHNGIDFDAIRKMTPQERQEFMLGMHNSRVEQMNTVSQARDSLFKVLDPQQQRTASTLLSPGGYGPGGMMGYGR